MVRQLWAPWRLEYVQAADDQAGCVFCTAQRATTTSASWSRARPRVRPPEPVSVLLGAPDGRAGTVTSESSASSRTRRRWRSTGSPERGLGALAQTFAPQGYNLGWNLGRIAGAGVVDHVHLHVVPRWAGDTNFMPVLADVKVMPEHLGETRRKLADAWPSRGPPEAYLRNGNAGHRWGRRPLPQVSPTLEEEDQQDDDQNDGEQSTTDVHVHSFPCDVPVTVEAVQRLRRRRVASSRDLDAVAVDLDSAIDDLYGQDLDAFVGERDRIAAELRERGSPRGSGPRQGAAQALALGVGGQPGLRVDAQGRRSPPRRGSPARERPGGRAVRRRSGALRRGAPKPERGPEAASRRRRRNPRRPRLAQHARARLGDAARRGGLG